MSLKRNTIYNIVVNISNVLFPFITTPYVSRVLGVENVGVVNFAMAYVAYFIMFAMLGIPTYGMRVIAQKNHLTDKYRDRVFLELFLIILTSTILVSIVYVVSILMIPTLYIQKSFLLTAGVILFLAPLNIEWYFSGREKFSVIAIRSISVKIIMVVAMFVFVKTKEDVMPYLVLLIGSTLLSHLWNWIYLFRKEFKFRVNLNSLSIRLHVKPLFVLFSSTLAISIYTMLDTLMLGFMSNYEEVGYYTSAIKISRIVIPIVVAMAPIVFVRVSALKEIGNMEQIKSILQDSFSYTYTLAIPITIGLITISPVFVPLFFGEEFIPSIKLMQILSILVFIMGIGNVFGSQFIQAMGYDRKFLIAVSIGTFINFTMNFCLIPSLGSEGAAISSVIAEFIVALLMFSFSLKIMKLSYSFKMLFAPILASLPIILFSWTALYLKFSEWEYLFFVVLCSALVYLCLMYFIFKNAIMVESINKVMSKFAHK